jgi:thioester reductase-like protein
MSESSSSREFEGNEVAIIGLSCRMPQARTAEEFWRNLCEGVEAFTSFTDEELRAGGVPEELLRHPRYVKSRPILEDVELFDAGFFGYTPREAELLDPQQRLFLESAWEALEAAGYDPARTARPIGVFCGVFMSTYLLNILSRPELVSSVGEMAVRHANDKDYLATRVSYKLDLHGPSINVGTSCSTSLVAVHLACQSLLNGECDLALAGGVSVTLPQRAGYLAEDGDILSPSGHCRAFDAKADGTVFGDGLGIVVLKRLSDALADGDRIRAIIRGSAINNDGSRKVGYTAPSVEGQAQVIAEALALAGVKPRTLSYVETHGTGTALGDPVEITALTQVFSASTSDKGFCALGAVKTNVGHLGTAAGVTGLIKTALCLEHKRLPPSLHFDAANPNIDFERSPFFVNTSLREWRAEGGPRRAGVSSFGMGGTNAHMVLEEAPPREASGPSRPWQLLLVSARSSSALEASTANLAQHLRREPHVPLADVAYTTHVGRAAFNHRRAVVCRDTQDATRALDVLDAARASSGVHAGGARSITFMFPGQGAQYPGMAAGLYRSEPSFRADVDRCAALLAPRLGVDLRAAIEPPEGQRLLDMEALKQTALAQPALFVVEYALARLWMRWGVQPTEMIGHSLGEYVAACLAGVLSLEDALGLVATRGALMQALPSGAMLAVPLPEERVVPLLGDALSLAATNAPGLCAVAGPQEAITALQRRLAEQGVEAHELHTSHAFHSAMMEPILDRFQAEVEKLTLRPPRLRYLSNVTGTWIQDSEATDPAYWRRHLRQTVRFSEGVRELLTSDRLLLEVGPGTTLGRLVRQHSGVPAQAVIPSLRHPLEKQEDLAFLLGALGKLWVGGAEVDWEAFHSGERRHRVTLPTYPFERTRYWVEPGQGQLPVAAGAPAPGAAQKAPAPTAYARPEQTAAYVAPRTEIEQKVAELFQRLLGIERVGLHDDFFELGGHSLLAAQLLRQLRELYPNTELPMQRLFDRPTVAGLAEQIDVSRREGASAVQQPVLDLRADVVLDPGLRPPEPRGPQQVLLTGATGFLGRFLLAELLKQTQADIHCLVRAPTAEEGYRRITEALREHGLWDPSIAGRIIALPGDLALPRLGLSEERFQQLARTVDAVYHNGAAVNFVSPYHTLKPANVGGTQEVIRLASLGRRKPIHFVSTSGTLSSDHSTGDETIFREDHETLPEHLHSGYSQSKWVAEQLIKLARDRGLPVTLYRPGSIAGHSQSGASNTTDFLFRAVKTWVDLKIAPDTEDSRDVTPVDYVAGALVHLSLREASAGRIFHLVNPRPMPTRLLVDWMRSRGYELQLIPPDEWHQQLTARVERAPDSPLFPLLPRLSAVPDVEQQRNERAARFRIDCQETLRALEGSPISCPPVDAALLGRYFDYFNRIGLLQPPGAAAKSTSA